jgi:phage terminase large subunit-like protein
LMTSTLDAPRGVLLGDQRPRLQSVPPCVSSEGERVAELASAAGLDLDDWERHVLEEGLGRAGDGQWSAFEKALIVSRQNGKGSILEALELAALFLDDFGVELILHSAHEFKTAAEAFRRVQARIENHASFRRRVRQVYLQRGAESVELKNGKRLRFIARSGGSGRGFSADLVILDEAFELGDAAMAALLPTLSARANPQIWYTSTAGLPTSTQLGAVRARGLRGDDPSLAFFEWSVDPDEYDPADPVCWAQANPGLGIRITPEYIAKERAALAPDEFARERLGVGDYPLSGAGWQVIREDAWGACSAAGARL